MNSGQELPRVKLNSCVRIANKFLSKRQLPNSWIRYSLYEIFTKSITVHFEFLERSYFSDCIQTGFATQPPWNVMYKTRHGLLGNSARTYARTPLKWGSQNYTLCPCWSCHALKWLIFAKKVAFSNNPFVFRTSKKIVTRLTFISKIQLVVYYQCCVLIGWATSRLFVIAHWQRKAPALRNKNNGGWIAFCWSFVLSRYFFDQLVGFY